MAEARVTVEPVFLLNKLLPLGNENNYSVAEICSAAEKASGHGTIDGAQRIGGLWRVYPVTADARVALLSRGIVLRGHSVQPRDKNPFLVRDDNGTEREVAAVKVIISNIPLSYNSEDILKTLEQKLTIKVRSRVVEERDRVDGKLTRWKTGRRFIFIDPPANPLPKFVQIGAFRASVYHRGQTVPECSRCLAKTHRTHECTSDVRCRVCYELGHVRGAEMCSLTPRAPKPTPPPNPPPLPPSPPVEKVGKETAVPVTPVQTKLDFHARRARKSSSASPSREQQKRSRSASTQRSPRQHTKKTARVAHTGPKEGSHGEPTPCREGREREADPSSGT